MAALLAALFAVSLKILPRFLQSCDFNGFLVAITCGFLTPICALVSAVLWMRAAFLVIAGRMERSEALQLEMSAAIALRSESPRDNHCSFQPQRHAKRCRSMTCFLAIVILITFGALGYVWVEFGRYQAFEQELDFKWGFLLSAPSPVPVWLGEFGENQESLWWHHMIRYLQERDVDFAYWSVNGEKYTGVPETPGIARQMFWCRSTWMFGGLYPTIIGS